MPVQVQTSSGGSFAISSSGSRYSVASRLQTGSTFNTYQARFTDNVVFPKGVMNYTIVAESPDVAATLAFNYRLGSTKDCKSCCYYLDLDAGNGRMHYYVMKNGIVSRTNGAASHSAQVEKRNQQSVIEVFADDDPKVDEEFDMSSRRAAMNLLVYGNDKMSKEEKALAAKGIVVRDPSTLESAAIVSKLMGYKMMENVPMTEHIKNLHRHLKAIHKLQMRHFGQVHYTVGLHPHIVEHHLANPYDPSEHVVISHVVAGTFDFEALMRSLLGADPKSLKTSDETKDPAVVEAEGKPIPEDADAKKEEDKAKAEAAAAEEEPAADPDSADEAETTPASTPATA